MPADSAAFPALRVCASAPRNGTRQPLESGFDAGNSPRVVIQICTMYAQCLAFDHEAEGSETGRPVQGSPGLARQAVLRLMPADSAAFPALRVLASASRNGSRQPLEGRFRTGNSQRVVIQICIVLARAREAEVVGSSRKQGFRVTGPQSFQPGPVAFDGPRRRFPAVARSWPAPRETARASLWRVVFAPETHCG